MRTQRIQELLVLREWEGTRDGGGRRQNTAFVCLRVCERDQEWGGASAGQNSSFVS